MEQNTDRMGFALIALSVVAFVLLAVNGPLKSTVNGFFNGFKEWQTATVNGITESNKQDITHTAYANNADGTLDFTPDYKSAVGLDILNITKWTKNVPMTNSTFNFAKNTDNSFKFTGRGTSGYEVLSKSFPAKVGDKLRFTVRYTNRRVFDLYNNEGLQFVVNGTYTDSAALTSKIVLPNEITTSKEYQLEYTVTSNNVWMQLNFGGVADSSQVDCDVKIEVENLTNPVKPKYIGTYTDKNDSASQDPSKYTWKLNPEYPE